MNDNPRVRRLADRIKEIVARAIDERVKDPRLGFVTVTDVRVSGDSQHASIFYTVYGSDEERAATAAALRSATGMLRTEVGRHVKVRLTPSLEFIEDTIPETSKTIDDLLIEARMRDAELEREREGKSFAGDDNPYRMGEEDPDPFFDDEFGADDDDAADEHDEGGISR